MLRIISEVEIKKIVLSVLVRGLKNRIVITNKYMILTLYIDEILNEGVSKTACFTTEVHLINDLKVNILINNNIMIS